MSPDRLGVGAAVPDAIAASPDTAHLKGRLVGKKRERDEAEAAATRMGDEDEEESRAGAIKKKAKLDPFDKSKQKKKAGPFIPPAPVQAPPSTSKEVGARRELEADTVASKSGSEPQSSNRRKKHKLLKLPATAISVASGLGNEDDAVVSNDPISPTLKRISKEEKRMFVLLELGSALKSSTPGQDVADNSDVLSTSSGSQRGKFNRFSRLVGYADLNKQNHPSLQILASNMQRLP